MIRDAIEGAGKLAPSDPLNITLWNYLMGSVHQTTKRVRLIVVWATAVMSRRSRLPSLDRLGQRSSL